MRILAPGCFLTFLLAVSIPGAAAQSAPTYDPATLSQPVVVAPATATSPKSARPHSRRPSIAWWTGNI